MDDQQQRRINEAAEQFTNAVTESYRTLTERATSTQELNAELTQQFFGAVIENLRRQAEETRGASQELADQTQRTQEAAQALTQESVDVYMDFLNSMFSFAPEGRSTQAAQGGAREVERTAATEAPPERGRSETERTSTEASAERKEVGGEQLPLENYDSLNIEQISERLDELSTEEVGQLRAYEAENKNRSTLLRRLDERIEAGSPS